LIMPDRVWNIFGIKFNLKPGKFNYKEHVVIVAMSNVSAGTLPVLIAKLYGGTNSPAGCVRRRCFICN
jgi:hypothetical protein